MATELNANQLIIDAINRGQLDNASANSLIRSVGFTDQFGEGRATNFFNTNKQANQAAINTLQQRGLIPLQDINSYMSASVTNPSLPSGTTIAPQTMGVQQGELQTTPTVSAPTVAKPANITAPTVQAQQASLDDLMVGYQDALNKISQGSGTYNAATVGDQTPQSVAAQGAVSDLATVQGQLKKLYADTQGEDVPLWAKGAVRKAEEVMSARGLGASSIAAGAITEAVQQSALNIAAQDAATYFQMDLTNLGNEQQTRLENTRLKQQSLLTDKAALNAAAQFNASSTQQVEMFQAQLVADIKTQNANRVAQMRTFNTAEVNKVNAMNAGNELAVSQFNSQQALAVDQFNAQYKFQAETFNANMAQVIDQSNVAWRRQINTANTAAINAANQINVQNAFNLSSSALNALWQRTRDEANWLWQSSEKDIDYQRQLGYLGANRNAQAYLQNNQNDFTTTQKFYEAIGKVGMNVLFDI